MIPQSDKELELLVRFAIAALPGVIAARKAMLKELKQMELPLG